MATELFVNGTMEGTEGTQSIPTGWANYGANGTVGTNQDPSETLTGSGSAAYFGVYYSTPFAQWVSEGIEQTLTGGPLEVGQTYVISFDADVWRTYSGGTITVYGEDAEGNVTNLFNTGVIPDTNQAGTHYSFEFVATSAYTTIGFRVPFSGSSNRYIVFDNASLLMICFARGTLVKTANGDVAVEDLQGGDMVFTRDHGFQPIRWVGSRKLDAIDLHLSPKIRPVLIRANSLAPGYPEKDLRVSPQHRVLVRSEIARRIFGEDEVLIPANKLLAIPGIEIARDHDDGVEYFHLLFDQHEIVSANGAWTESLFTGPEALRAVPAEARAEIQEMFPEICGPDFEHVAARHIPEKGKHMKKLALRHQQNNKPLYAERS